MPPKNPYAQYNNNKVLTASPAELTLMLYEGAIKFANQARKEIELGEYGNSIIYIQKVRNIIVELQSTLDFKYPVAKDFDNIYTYMFHLMIEINKDHNLETVDELLAQLRDIRDIWKQIMHAGKRPG